MLLNRARGRPLITHSLGGARAGLGTPACGGKGTAVMRCCLWGVYCLYLSASLSSNPCIRDYIYILSSVVKDINTRIRKYMTVGVTLACRGEGKVTPAAPGGRRQPREARLLSGLRGQARAVDEKVIGAQRE